MAASDQEACVHLRSSPTFRISHSILVNSMLLRPNGHSCLSSRLLFSRTIWKTQTLGSANRLLTGSGTGRRYNRYMSASLNAKAQ